MSEQPLATAARAFFEPILLAAFYPKIKSQSRRTRRLGAAFWVAWLFVFAVSKAQTPEIDSLQKAAKAAAARADRRAEAENLRALARAQADAGRALEALPNAQRAMQLFEAMGEKKEAIRSVTPQLVAHQQLHNGQKIVEAAQKGIAFALEIRDTALLVDMTTALGIGFDELNEDQKAVDCYFRCIALEDALGVSSAQSHGNASSTFSSMGEFEKALFHARTAFSMASAKKDTFIMALGKLNEAYALALMRRGDEALRATDETEKLAFSLGEAAFDRDIFYLKSLGNAAKKDFEKAYRSHLAFYKIDSTLASSERNAQFAELETVYETKQKEAENVRLAASLERRNFWAIGASVAAILLLFIAFLQRKRLETEKALALAQRRRADDEAQFRLAALDDFARSMREKNAAIEALKKDLEARSEASAMPADDRFSLLEQLAKASILTDEQWRGFRQKFERAHPAFFEKFTAAVPDATEAEKRLAALTKLEMTNAEMAAMLGISPDSVVKTRQRLRKKLDGQEVGDLVRAIA